MELPERLTAKKEENFSEWYNQVLWLAEIIDKRYNVKGCFVWKPYGYEIMLNIKKIWDNLFKKNGYKEVYFPLLVPLEYAKINDSWFEGFKDEAFYVSAGEQEKQWILRPTGEPAMYPIFKLWIRSYRDLPLRVYETVSSFRYETKHTRPLIRDREITVWHEIHTAHTSKEEAEKETKIHMEMWDEMWNKLCLKPIKVKKPQWEVFPGAVGAIEYYSIFPSGKIMENGSVNNLGQAYAKKFDIKFRDKDGKEKYVWQTCTGNGARLLAAVIAIHGDNHGLVLPSSIAPIQIAIVPIQNKEEIIKVVKKIEKELSKFRVKVYWDERDFVDKFYETEIKGIPLRIEIGERELNKGVVKIFIRDLLEKKEIKLEKINLNYIKKELEEYDKRLLEKCMEFNKKRVKFVDKLEDMKKLIKEGKIAKVNWCGSKECWDKIKELEEGFELFGSSIEEEKEGYCIICHKKTKIIGYVGNTY